MPLAAQVGDSWVTVESWIWSRTLPGPGPPGQLGWQAACAGPQHGWSLASVLGLPRCQWAPFVPSLALSLSQCFPSKESFHSPASCWVFCPIIWGLQAAGSTGTFEQNATRISKQISLRLRGRFFSCHCLPSPEGKSSELGALSPDSGI